VGALQDDARKDREAVFVVRAILALQACCDESALNAVERKCKLLAVAPAPLTATDEPSELTLRERYVSLNRPAVVGVFFQERDECLVCERAGLAIVRMGQNLDMFLLGAFVEMDFAGSRTSSFASWQNNAPMTRSKVLSM